MALEWSGNAEHDWYSRRHTQRIRADFFILTWICNGLIQGFIKYRAGYVWILKTVIRSQSTTSSRQLKNQDNAYWICSIFSRFSLNHRRSTVHPWSSINTQHPERDCLCSLAGPPENIKFRSIMARVNSTCKHNFLLKCIVFTFWIFPGMVSI